MPNGPLMTLAEQTGRRLLLAGYSPAHPVLATIRAWNAAVLQRGEVTQ